MKLKLSDLIRWHGKISRMPFFLWAVSLFAVKYNLDRLLLGVMFGRSWSLFSYFDRPIPWIGRLSPAHNSAEFAVLLAASVPFLWVGVALCLKRLRSARLPLWLALLFVVPILKWFLFVTLALVPERPETEAKSDRQSDGRRAVAWLPESILGSASLAVGTNVLLALGATALGAQILRDYGWGLFVGVPFSMGFLAAIIHSAREERSLLQSQMVAFVAVTLTGVALLVVALEGVICLLMAAPLAFALAAIGALAGHAVQAGRSRRPPQLYCVPLLAIPLMLGTENLRPGPAPLMKVVTTVDVDAPRDVVWRHVVSFSELPPPRELVFKLGVAYPVRAEIHGHGVGAVRHCNFSTGPFVEPIEVWDEPRLLGFSVTKNPEPLQEWTPYRTVHPPHLDGFLVSKRGQFLLTALPDGRTRVEGTTWYHHSMWPEDYWQLWSDKIIHSIHRRVLNHVKGLAEAENDSGAVRNRAKT